MNDLFVLDIGNSATKWGRFRASCLVDRGALPDPPGGRTPASIAREVARLAGAGSRSVLVSVVPALGGAARGALDASTGRAPLVVSASVRLPFRMEYLAPHTLGADRLAAVAGAVGRGSGRPVVVVDAGTALTLEVIDRDGVYLGGVIAPGPPLAARALRVGTAQLPEVVPGVPGRLVGRTTEEAIRSGMLFGLAACVEGLVGRIGGELGSKPHVVATGGWAPFLAGATGVVDEVDPDLVLVGAAAIARVNE